MEIDFNHLHHAYLVIGSREASEKTLLSLFEKHGESLIGSPDYFVWKGALFGVDDARALSEQAITKAFVKKKVFFIAPEKITLEAQNALLKTFEEPVADTHFFLVVRDEHVIIPTLRSRLQLVRVEGEREDLKQAEKFLKLSVKDRLNFVKKFVDKEESLSAFLDELLLELRGRAEVTSALEQVYKLRLVSDDRAASSRMILEHLALVL